MTELAKFHRRLRGRFFSVCTMLGAIRKIEGGEIVYAVHRAFGMVLTCNILRQGCQHSPKFG